MSLSPEVKTQAMKTVIDWYLERFQTALALSAKRGGYHGDLPRLYTRLALFKKNGDMDFNAWFTITQEAGQTFIEWVNWYRRD